MAAARAGAKSDAPFGPPSSFLVRFAPQILGQPNLPILDAGCGGGRHAVALALRGSDVIGVDRDSKRLAQLGRQAPLYLHTHTSPGVRPGRVQLVRAELRPDRWLYGDECFGAIIAVHFLNVRLLEHFSRSLVPSGHLFIETFGGQGGNYLDLPAAGELRSLLEPEFELPFYREKEVGPPTHRAVSVKLLARKR
jgi:SAM-dependent methyltransferase